MEPLCCTPLVRWPTPASRGMGVDHRRCAGLGDRRARPRDGGDNAARTCRGAMPYLRCLGRRRRHRRLTPSFRGYSARCRRRRDWNSLPGKPEATIQARYRERHLQASENDTVYPGESFRHPLAKRAVIEPLRNQTVDAWSSSRTPRNRQAPGERREVIAPPASGRSCAINNPEVDAEGTSTHCRNGPDRASASLSKVQSAGDIVREIADEARSHSSAVGHDRRLRRSRRMKPPNWKPI